MNPLQMLPALLASSPASSDPDARISVHVGSQTLRIPARKVAAMLDEALASVEHWSHNGSGPLHIAYGMLKVPANFLYPFLGPIISQQVGFPVELPKRPRHTDPVLWCARLLLATFCPLLPLCEWTLDVADDGDLGAGHVDIAGAYRYEFYQPALLPAGDELVEETA